MNAGRNLPALAVGEVQKLTYEIVEEDEAIEQTGGSAKGRGGKDDEHSSGTRS